MAFSEETKKEIFRNAGGQCECNRLSCRVHTSLRCPTKLVDGRWHAHHKTAVASGGKDVASNGEALCIPCHEGTQTYGRS
jgi:5-methylcytosine-specific restriction endonuclease McrA